MKKSRGKALALVLSLALVVSSFPVTFASAATKSVTGSVSDTDEDEIWLVNGDTSKSVSGLKGWINPTLDTKDHQDLEDEVEIAAISHSSGDSLVKWDIDDDGDATLTVKKSGATGTEVLSVLYEDTYPNDDGDDVTVKARKNFTVHVLDEGSLVIGKTYATLSDRDGKAIKEPDTLPVTHGFSVDIQVYSVGKSGDAKAVYTPVAVTSLKDGTLTAGAYIELSSTTNAYLPASIETTAGSADPIALTVGKGDDRDRDASVSNLTVTVRRIKDNRSISNDSDDKYTLKTKIEKKIDVAQAVINTTDAAVTAYTIDTDHGTKLYAGGTEIATVTDAEVVFPEDTTSVTVDDGSVKKISGTVGILTINDDASVGEVDVDSGEVHLDGGKVGDITTVGEVTVTSGKAGEIDNTDSTTPAAVEIYGGTVGAIESDSSVTIDSSDEDTAVATGVITANTVTIYSEEAKVSVAGLKADANDATFTVKGEDVTLGTVDFDYRSGVALNLGDEDDAFVGAIVAPVNAVNGSIASENEDTVASISGSVDVDNLSIGDETVLTFTGDVKVDSIDGDGTLKIAAGKLYITGGVSGTTLQLTDSTLTAGTVVFKADSDTVDADDFDTYGFTLKKTEGNSVDTFTIDTLRFAGLQITSSSTKVAVGESGTFTAVAYPGGTSIPEGATVHWGFDGSDNVFDVTYEGNVATVKIIALDPDFASENHGTLTATLQDEDGYDLDDYGTASVAISAVAVPEFKSDTTADFSVAPGASYTFKITSATAPNLVAGTGGVFNVTPVGKSGNDYFIKITAIGKVGDASRIYVNGTKLLVATIKSDVKSDTTQDITVKKGASYTYKITTSVAPTFAIGTGNVFTYKLTAHNGNDYFYQITATGAVGAKAGIYVNGQKINAATIG